MCLPLFRRYLILTSRKSAHAISLYLDFCLWHTLEIKELLNIFLLWFLSVRCKSFQIYILQSSYQLQHVQGNSLFCYKALSQKLFIWLKKSGYKSLISPNSFFLTRKYQVIPCPSSQGAKQIWKIKWSIEFSPIECKINIKSQNLF